MLTVYGIKSCDTMKKAMHWLTEHEIDHALHDYKKAGIAPDMIKQWLTMAGADRVINRRGTTWRKLSEQDKAACNSGDPDAIADVLAAHSSVIKRPIVPVRNTVLVGFNPADWAEVLR